jgi:hypothetical protein
MALGYVHNLRTKKGSRTVDFASRFEMIIESVNLETSSYVKNTNLDVKSTVPELFEPFFDSKDCERNPRPFIMAFLLICAIFVAHKVDLVKIFIIF